MPTHPMAVHLGDIKDVEDFKQKITKQKQLKRKTLKAVKEFYNLDDIKELEKELDLMNYGSRNNGSKRLRGADDAELNSLQKKSIGNPPTLIENVKVRTTNELARPIFSNMFERYEWHLNNGCITPEDEKWVECYKMTDEYKEIYDA